MNTTFELRNGSKVLYQLFRKYAYTTELLIKDVVLTANINVNVSG